MTTGGGPPEGPEADIDARLAPLLRDLERGDPEVQGRLFELLADELRSRAAGFMARQPAGHTLQPTALLNEAYLKLIAAGPLSVASRGHFVNLVARAMRQVLVDHARTRTRQKRGGKRARTRLDELVLAYDEREIPLAELDSLLERLEASEPAAARVLELRCFVGLTVEQAAEALGVSRSTVEARWRIAKDWFARQVG